MPETSGTSGASRELANLTKRYPGAPRPAVDNDTVETKAGELVVFVRPSGCGKSTTLKMINRLIEPMGGRIRVNGAGVTGIDPVTLRRKVGYAIQSAGLLPHMTVAQNIALVPRMISWGKNESLRRGDMMRAQGSPARAGTLVSDTVTRGATLRDALEAVLTDNAGRVAVTGRRGEYTGVVDMETLMTSVHELVEADRLEASEHRHALEEIRAVQKHAEQEGAGGGEGTA
ncbi:MAG: ATP-binding cassette domain-containing protein [Streptomyces sp.]